MGMPLPAEYRQFLALCRYLKMSDGIEIGGFRQEGMYVTEVPWVSDKHRQGVKYLVFANYWRYADGDQLMFDMTDPNHPVVAYLHEHGPLFERYAPSFSLALWRLLHEYEDEVLDACLFGIGEDRRAALAQAAVVWITAVAGPIKSFLDNKPVCMTCQAGVAGGNASEGYSQSD